MFSQKFSIDTKCQSGIGCEIMLAIPYMIQSTLAFNIFKPKFNLIPIDLLPAADSGFWSHHVINVYYLSPVIGLQLSLDLVRRFFNISNINRLPHYQNICVFAHILLDEEDVFNIYLHYFSISKLMKCGIVYSV